MIRVGANLVAWYLILCLLAVSFGPDFCRAQENAAGALQLAGVTAPGGGAVPAAPTSNPAREGTALALLAREVAASTLDVDQRPLTEAAAAFLNAIEIRTSPSCLPTALAGAVEELNGLFRALREWISVAAHRLPAGTAQRLADVARRRGSYATIPTQGNANGDMKAMATADLLEQHFAGTAALSRITAIEELRPLARDMRARLEGRDMGVLAVIGLLSMVGFLLMRSAEETRQREMQAYEQRAREDVRERLNLLRAEEAAARRRALAEQARPEPSGAPLPPKNVTPPPLKDFVSAAGR